jgi:hypothetical protein
MSRYTAAEEEAIRTADQVRDWKASGLIDVNRAAVLEQELRTDFRRTHRALRAVLFLFAAVVIQAAVGLVAVVVTPDEEAVAATLALMAGCASLALADVLIARFRFYRFGVEEACVVCGIALFAGGVTLFASVAGVRGDTQALVACVAIACIAAAAYWRFGLLYCAVAAVAAAAFAPFFLELPEMHGRVLAAAVLLAIHAVSGVLRRPVGEDYPGDDYAAIEAIAWLGTYAVLNLELTQLVSGARVGVSPGFFWFTYVAIWFLPVIGLYRGLQQKHHWMIRASMVMALATIATNKLYLGWPRHTWDPILLGVVLIATALGLRRWLSRGASGQRHGFTPRRLLSSEDRLMAHAAMVAAALKPEQTVHAAATTDPGQFSGGRSGGAGAGGSF